MSRRFVLEESSSAPSGIDYDAELNEEQRAVVKAPGGPMLVIAGAGSGKTRALTFRVAHLIDQGVRPNRILVLTFTNRAAKEMTGRVRELVGAAARAVWSGTFHAIGRRILREFGDVIGYPKNFGILDREDGSSLMRQCIAEQVTNRAEIRFPKASLVIRVLSAACNTGRPIGDLLTERYPRFVEHIDTIERVVVAYQSKKFEFGVMDFDDLLTNWRRLLLESEEVRAQLTRRFEHVMVDEYQDTNAIQSQIVDMMSSGYQNLMVVGDDCQSIYAFRGAEFRNILEFPERNEGTVIYRLETNYRSTPQILRLANESIHKNTLQFDKTLRPVKSDGLLAGYVRCTNEDEQSRFAAQRILQLRDEGVELDRIAVLYRAHWQSMELQVELGRRNIPFKVHSGQRFFEQRHVKDVLAFLRFAENPRDELAFQRIASLAPGIGLKTASRLYQHLRGYEDIDEGLRAQATAKAAGSRAKHSWPKLRDVLTSLRSPTLQGDPATSLDRVLNGFYEEYAISEFDNGDNRIRELQSLATMASRYDSVDDFLQTVALAGEVTGVDQVSSEEADEAVILSSIHQAKGLEFHTVFLIWLAEDRFPTTRAMQEDLEEERRLFYVAVTRAEQELYLTMPCSAWERGAGLVALRPSPFIQELEGCSPPVLERIELVRR
ncbi:MAG: DNA helicase-2/ATP-dependent DNA helicase PcrA [Bradymonadia bacterium]|jgi:DNA helicase-2/ATP-dependent DNA helicase PcrA